MITWESFDPPESYAVPGPADKPWRVTRYRAHWYWGYRIGPVWSAHFRWYWQANCVSWFYHHVLGWSCNTWRRNVQ